MATTLFKPIAFQCHSIRKSITHQRQSITCQGTSINHWSINHWSTSFNQSLTNIVKYITCQRHLIGKFGVNMVYSPIGQRHSTNHWSTSCNPTLLNMPFNQSHFFQYRAIYATTLCNNRHICHASIYRLRYHLMQNFVLRAGHYLRVVHQVPGSVGSFDVAIIVAAVAREAFVHENRVEGVRDGILPRAHVRLKVEG